MIEFPITLTSGGSVQLPGHAFALALGYTKNRGVYRLAVTATGEWEGLTIRAFWHVPDGKDPASLLVVDGYVDVPGSVTAQPGTGCITFEGTDGTKTVTSADLHYRVSANSGTEDGTEPEPGTPAWQAFVDAVHTDAAAAEQAKTDAQTAASEAADSLQELKDGIASGDFKGEKGDTGPQGPKGDTGPAVALDTTLTHEGEAADAKATGDAISAVKARQNILVGTETGNPLAVDDAFPAPLCGLTVYGRSTQDGTPTPDAPVPIVSAGDSGSVAVKVTGENLLNPRVDAHVTVTSEGLILDGTIPQHIMITIPLLAGTYTFGDFTQKLFVHSYINKIDAAIKDVRTRVITATDQVMLYIARGTYSKELVKPYIVPGEAAPQSYEPYREQLLTLPTPTGLPGIPVTSGGNYTDQNGQQWVCDKVDLERGVKVQRVKAVDLSTCAITGTTELAATKRLSILLPLKGRDYKTEALCNKLQFLVSFTEDRPHFYVDTANAQVFIPIGAKNPGEGEYFLSYVLATPIEKPLTPAEISAYKALTAYGPDTVVQAGDGAGVKLVYQRDVNIAIKKLEDAVASMT